jgi:energy-coupling factor transport system substrate-specific component
MSTPRSASVNVGRLRARLLEVGERVTAIASSRRVPGFAPPSTSTWYRGLTGEAIDLRSREAMARSIGCSRRWLDGSDGESVSSSVSSVPVPLLERPERQLWSASTIHKPALATAAMNSESRDRRTASLAEHFTESFSQTLLFTLIPLGICLNLSIAMLVHVLKIPVFLDAVGTIIVTLLAGLRAGLMTGVAGNLSAGLLISPVYPFFCGTQAAIALYIHLLARIRAFSTLPRAAVAGIGLGIVSGIVSAPVVTYLFGGITGGGTSLITVYFLSTGRTLLKSTFLSGIASEPLDKALQCLLAVWLLRGVPQSLMARLSALLAQGKQQL